MEDKKTVKTKAHAIHIEDRGKMTISGVTHVGSFDEENITLMTELGGLIIQGKAMHINKLNVDDGNVTIEGSINSCNYSDKVDTANRGSIITRLFK